MRAFVFLYIIENSPVDLSRESQISTNTFEFKEVEVRNGTKSESLNGLHVTSGGHVGGQEQKQFSPLGTKTIKMLHFNVNSSRKTLLY